ncbi:MAG: alpha/beta fold hydrolase [Janthinobacterium lividum]
MRFGYADTTMGQVHYRRAGVGAPLLLLGSSGRSSSIFEGLLPLLAPYFDAIALDTPGFGQSCPLPQGATIEALAGCAAEVLNALGIPRCHLYGLHTGNKIATAFAGQWPERVDRLVLAGQSHSLIPDRALRNETILAIVQGYFAQPTPVPFTAIADWAAIFNRVSAAWWDPALLAAGADAAARRDARNVVLDELLSDGTAALYRANFAYDLGSSYAGIRAPTTVLEIVTPDEDRTVGRQAEAVAALIPGAAIRTIAEPGGHTLTLENRARDLAAIIVEALRRPATS